MLLIAGASARAAAFSALRAGLLPLCLDLFADSDLARVCPVQSVPRWQYPSGIWELSRRLPPGPWLYTGALENQPDLVTSISRDRPLWGNDSATLRRVRDPLLVSEDLRNRGIPCPSVSASAEGLPRDGAWLAKPLHSGGGERIEPLDDGWVRGDYPTYFQKRITGPSFSAIFLSAPDENILVGITRQWIGRPGANFAYAGSLGPWSLATPLADQLQNFAEALCAFSGLRGLWGVDFVLNDNQVWPVEVNPRYTASVEVLELATGRAWLKAHGYIFDPESISRTSSPSLPSWGYVGKRLLFASHRLRFPTLGVGNIPSFDPFRFPNVADVPHEGTIIEAGEPILTVLAHGDSLEECERSLRENVDVWNRLTENDFSDS